MFFLQQLTITLMSDWTNKLVAFEKDLRKADTIRPETFTADQEWYLCRHVVTEATSTVKTEGSSANDYPLYHIKCHVKRKNGYYLWNIAMIIVRRLSVKCMQYLLMKLFSPHTSFLMCFFPVQRQFPYINHHVVLALVSVSY